jgi:hypothetical protein
MPLVEELSDRTGEGCAQKSEAEQVTGIVLGERFEARYQNERLAELTVGPARFTRVAVVPRLASPPDLYGGSFAIEEGAGTPGVLAVSPPIEVDRVALPPWDRAAARALAERVHDSFAEVEPSPADWRLTDGDDVGGCMAHARRFREWARRSGHATALVFGLLVDDGRAYPHAWVRVGVPGGATTDLDPTTLEEVSPHTHLALAAAAGEPGPEVGKRYLELANGARRVVRQP